MRSTRKERTSIFFSIFSMWLYKKQKRGWSWMIKSIATIDHFCRERQRGGGGKKDNSGQRNPKLQMNRISLLEPYRLEAQRWHKSHLVNNGKRLTQDKSSQTQSRRRDLRWRRETEGVPRSRPLLHTSELQRQRPSRGKLHQHHRSCDLNGAGWKFPFRCPPTVTAGSRSSLPPPLSLWDDRNGEERRKVMVIWRLAIL